MHEPYLIDVYSSEWYFTNFLSLIGLLCFLWMSYFVLKNKYIDTGRAKLLFRDFPLDRTAMLGSMVTQCMNEKQFFPVLNRLFQKQPEWTQSEDILESIFKTLQPLGIEKPMLLSCLEDNETNKNRWKLLLAGRDYAAKQKGVDATPTFFVNGKKVEGRFDIKKLNSLIE